MFWIIHISVEPVRISRNVSV